MNLVHYALDALEAGLNPQPPKEDGSKRPDADEWTSRQSTMATEDEIRRWYANGRTGLGLICGAISGGLELFEFEGRAVEDGTYGEFLRAASASGLGPLVDRITEGYSESTPTGGVHWLSRCSVTKTEKLARRPATEAELREHPDDRYKVLVETKGEGGYVIVAPSWGSVHPSGEPWEMMSGSFATIATITPEERAALHRLARTFDQMPKPPPHRPCREATMSGGPRPGDDFNARAEWAEILEPHGWRSRFTTRGGNQHWTRPGKEHGTSATVNEDGRGVLYVFTSSTPFEPDTAYDRFGAYAVLNHAGDHRAAAVELRAAGYGEQRAEDHRSVPEWVREEPPSDEGEPFDEPDGADLHEPDGAAGHVEHLDDDAQPWPELDPVAMHGLAGEVVAAIAPHTEADPVAMLVSLLVAFGNAANSGPHARVGGAQHPPRINAVIVGATAKARKGTSWRDVRPVLEVADEEWTWGRHVDGLSSGEGLIAAVADPKVSAKGEEVIAGSSDKRLLVVEEEFSRVLAVAKREGSTLTPVIRSAWDTGTLRVLTKAAQVATGAHISIIGHITVEELRRSLTETDMANGFANRFVFVCARRGPLLPSGGQVPAQVVGELGGRMRSALVVARTLGTMARSPAGERLWERLYTEMAEDDPGGLLGSIVARADAQTLRLSVVYAALDGSKVIEEEHVAAAWALWSYCRASAGYVFGDTEGDDVADRLLAAVLAAGEAGLDFGAQSEVFSRHVPAKRLALARAVLERRGRVYTTSENTGGRPRQVTRAMR